MGVEKGLSEIHHSRHNTRQEHLVDGPDHLCVAPDMTVRHRAYLPLNRVGCYHLV